VGVRETFLALDDGADFAKAPGGTGVVPIVNVSCTVPPRETNVPTSEVALETSFRAPQFAL
jgi:hypothetical protein